MKIVQCLSDAGAEIDKCLPGAEGHVMNAGCYMRYSTRKFFGEAALAAQNEKGRENKFRMNFPFPIHAYFHCLSYPYPWTCLN